MRAALRAHRLVRVIVDVAALAALYSFAALLALRVVYTNLVIFAYSMIFAANTLVEAVRT